MKANTEDIRKARQPGRALDRFDRKILAAMVSDARSSYAEIGRIAGLSAPAVHERAKRLRESGVLKAIRAIVDGAAVGKPFLAFVHVDAEGWAKSQRLMKLLDYPEVEEMHSVAGDTSVILKVRTESAHALELFLGQLYALRGVRNTKSYVVLSTFLERPVQAEVTAAWPPLPLPQE